MAIVSMDTSESMEWQHSIDDEMDWELLDDGVDEMDWDDEMDWEESLEDMEWDDEMEWDTTL